MRRERETWSNQNVRLDHGLKLRVMEHLLRKLAFISTLVPISIDHPIIRGATVRSFRRTSEERAGGRVCEVIQDVYRRCCATACAQSCWTHRRQHLDPRSWDSDVVCERCLDPCCDRSHRHGLSGWDRRLCRCLREARVTCTRTLVHCCVDRTCSTSADPHESSCVVEDSCCRCRRRRNGRCRWRSHRWRLPTSSCSAFPPKPCAPTWKSGRRTCQRTRPWCLFLKA